MKANLHVVHIVLPSAILIRNHLKCVEHAVSYRVQPVVIRLIPQQSRQGTYHLRGEVVRTCVAYPSTMAHRNQGVN